MDKYLSPFISAYRQNSSTQHILIHLLVEWSEGLDNNFVVEGVLMDLFKAFYCIPHDLLIAKLRAYGYDHYLVQYLYSYLDNRKRCVHINHEKSSLQNITSGVPQGSIVGSTLFNLFFNDFLLFILIASVHNFADDSSLSNIVKASDSLKHPLESECKVAIKLFHENKIIVNPDNFQAIVLDKHRSSNSEVKFIIGSEQIQEVPSVDILGIAIDDKLNFNLHMDKICLKSANQLNALTRLKRFLENEERKVLINSFVLSNFNYCPLVWMLTNAKSVHKIEAILRKGLGFYVKWL